MNTHRLVLLALPLSLAACEVPGTAGPVDTGLPCGVEEVLADNCQSCHAAQPKFGAPMSLLTWDDVQAQLVTDPTRSVAERMRERVAEGSMPPSGEISEEDRHALLDWLDEGAPRAAVGEGCNDMGDGGTPPPPPPSASCDGTLHEFLAYDEGGDREAPFQVSPADDNAYQCFVFPSTFAAGDRATRFDVSIGDDRVIHHLILYSTATRPDQDVFRCERMPGDVSFVTGWAPGGAAIEMPPGIGAEVPQPDQWLILQAHYHNPTGHADAMDRSGLTACVTDRPVEQTAAVVSLGNAGFEVPARSEGHAISGDCDVPMEAPTLHVLGSAPHMHQAGRTITSEIHRAGGGVDVLTHVEHWDFANQGFFMLDEEILIEPGDMLRTTCVYDNPSGQVVRNGERTEDEMCLNFLYVYPAPPETYRSCVQGR